jgi:hypothetical protein
MQTLATGNVGITSAEISTNSSGRAVLVYSSVTSDSPLLVDIFAQTCDLATGSCGTPAALEPDTTGGWDVEPQVAVNAAGNATAIWRRYDSATSVFSLRANRMIGGSWGSAVLIEAQATDVSSRHSVAMDTDGNAIAVWAQQVGVQPNQHVTIFANRFDVSAGWGAEVQIEPQTRAEDFFPAQGPRVAYGPDGNAITVWQSGGGVISAMEFANGSWAPMRDIGPGGSGVSHNAQIVFDNTGAGVAIFVENAGPANATCIKVSRYE